MRNALVGLTMTMTLVLAAGSHAGLWAQGERKRPGRDNVDLAAAEDLGKEVERALDQARATGLNNLKLRKAVLTMETGSAVEGGVSVNFIIFTISNKAKKGEVHKSVLTFGSLGHPSGGGTKVKKLEEPLADAILFASEVSAEIRTLPLAEATVNIEFVVEKKAGGGIAFKILGADVGGDLDLSKVSKNSLEVTFSR